MKSIFIIIAFTFTFGAMNAQEKPEIQKLIEAVGVQSHIKVIREYEAMWTKPEIEKEYLVDFDSIVPVFLHNVENYYAQRYTQDEIQDLLKFYNTDLGKKISKNATKLTNAYLEADAVWDDFFNEVVFTYMKN